MPYSVDDILKPDEPTSTEKLDSLLAPPATSESGDYQSLLRSQIADYDAAINAIVMGDSGDRVNDTRAEAPVGTPQNPYGGAIEDGYGAYQKPDGSLYLDTNRSTPYVRQNGRPGYRIDARAPMAASEVASRNKTEQFFAARRGATTREDMRWRSIFPEGPGANRLGGPAKMSAAGIMAANASAGAQRVARYMEPGSTAEVNTGTATRAAVKPIAAPLPAPVAVSSNMLKPINPPPAPGASISFGLQPAAIFPRFPR